MSVPLTKKKLTDKGIGDESSPRISTAASQSNDELPADTELIASTRISTDDVAVVDITYDSRNWGWKCLKCGSHNIIPVKFSNKHQRRAALMKGGEHGQKHGAWRIGADVITN